MTIRRRRSRDRSFCRAWELRRHLDLDDVVLDGVYHQITDGVQAELPHDVAAMCLHGFGAQIQEYRHFLGALSFSKKLSDFPLPGGQCRQIRRFIPRNGMALLQEARQHQVGYSWREKQPLVL